MGIKQTSSLLQKKINAFDPNSPGLSDGNLFGLPFGVQEARCVVVPVPWEVTVSYGGGTANGPEAILEASKQIDLYDPVLPDAWKLGVAMDSLPSSLKVKSGVLRKKAEQYIARVEEGKSPESSVTMRKTRDSINAGCEEMVRYVKKATQQLLEKDKMVALVGGDHSTPLGFLQALGEKYPSFGILQIDAHADLREAYEGFDYSHASIMHNALKIKQVKKLVQVGIRDYCEDEFNAMRRMPGRIKTHFDRDMKAAQYRGNTIQTQHQKIAKQLPNKVYISFDIDGLDPKLCPNTGTPVPGGLEFEEALHLIQAVVQSGRKIIGFDINEVSPSKGQWDANVGARLLFRMINLMAKSQSIRL